MADRKALVLVGGTKSELPAGDNLSGIQNWIGSRHVKVYEPLGNATTQAGLGVGNFTLSGTATTANVATTNRHTMQPRLDVLVTTPATTAVAGFRDNLPMYNIGNTYGGFLYNFRFGFATGVTNSTKRGFCGFANSAGNPTDVNPSTQTNIVGVGFDSGDTNFHIMHNDGSGTATRIDTGIAVPSADRTGIYELEMYAAPGSAQVEVTFTHVDSGTVFSTTVTTDLPGNTLFLAHRAYHSVGGTSSVVGITFFNGYIEKSA